MGGHEGDHGSGRKLNLPHGVKIPDWRQWKHIDENFPGLRKYIKKLSDQGLKDPWIRNYAWAYDRRLSQPWHPWKPIFRGFWLGFGIFALIVVKKTFFPVQIDHVDRYPLLRERQDPDFQ